MTNKGPLLCTRTTARVRSIGKRWKHESAKGEENRSASLQSPAQTSCPGILPAERTTSFSRHERCDNEILFGPPPFFKIKRIHVYSLPLFLFLSQGFCSRSSSSRRARCWRMRGGWRRRGSTTSSASSGAQVWPKRPTTSPGFCRCPSEKERRKIANLAREHL